MIIASKPQNGIRKIQNKNVQNFGKNEAGNVSNLMLPVQKAKC